MRLTSTRSQATQVRVRLEPPAGTVVEPQTTELTVEAYGSAQTPIRLRTANPVEGESLAVSLDFAGHSLEHKLPVGCLPPVENLPGELSLHSVWEASRMSHNTGCAAEDREAYSAYAWRAIPGEHAGQTHLVWGPYEELPPGRYAVAFRLKAEGQGDAPLAKLDVFNFWRSKEGKDGTYAQRTLRGKDLARSCRYADYWLDFEHGPTGKVEYRVWWPGGSPLSLDRVVVFRKS